MATLVQDYDISERLDSETEIFHYLEAAFEDGDPQVIKAALNDVAKARGMTEIAKQTDISRSGIYRALSETGNPSLTTLSAILRSFGMKLGVQKAN